MSKDVGHASGALWDVRQQIQVSLTKMLGCQQVFWFPGWRCPWKTAGLTNGQFVPCTSSMFFLNHDVMVTSGGDRSVIEGKLWRIGGGLGATWQPWLPWPKPRYLQHVNQLIEVLTDVLRPLQVGFDSRCWLIWICVRQAHLRDRRPASVRSSQPLLAPKKEIYSLDPGWQMMQNSIELHRIPTWSTCQARVLVFVASDNSKALKSAQTLLHAEVGRWHVGIS